MILRYNYNDNTQNSVVTNGAVSVQITHRNMQIPTMDGTWFTDATSGSSNLNFNASYSNPIFGSSDKVQIKSFQALMIIKA